MAMPLGALPVAVRLAASAPRAPGPAAAGKTVTWRWDEEPVGWPLGLGWMPPYMAKAVALMAMRTITTTLVTRDFLLVIVDTSVRFNDWTSRVIEKFP